MKKQLLLVLLGFSIGSAYAIRNKNQKQVKPYTITVTNNTGKNIKLEFAYDKAQHHGKKDLLLSNQPRQKNGMQKSAKVMYCIKKVKVIEKITPFKETVVLEKDVNICEDTHFDINLSKDGTFSISPDFFSGWGWWSY